VSTEGIELDELLKPNAFTGKQASVRRGQLMGSGGLAIKSLTPAWLTRGPEQQVSVEQKLHTPPPKIRSISSLPIRSKSSGTVNALYQLQ